MGSTDKAAAGAPCASLLGEASLQGVEPPGHLLHLLTPTVDRGGHRVQQIPGWDLGTRLQTPAG
jgi:hypothetical protein